MMSTGRRPLEEEFRTERLPEPTPRNHAVQFYEDDEVLCDIVGSYVGAGLAAGEKVLVIATEPHRQALAERLTGNAFDVERARATGQLALHDARETLTKFMAGSTPDAKLFNDIVGGILDECGAAHVRAFGEMVGLLWMDGNLQAAIRVEGLWNELARQRSFSLLCGYVMGNFDKEAHRDEFEEVCRAHTHVLPAGNDAGVHGGAASVPEFGFLWQRARALEDEIRHRAQLEITLKDALKERERLLVELEADRVRQFESEQRQIVQRSRLELLQAITASFARALKPRDIAEPIVHEGTAAMGAPSGGIWLLAEDAKTLELVAP